MDSQTLLTPLPGEHACGEDISYDPKFLELDTLIAGKPETQFSSGEEPDWKAIRDACLALLSRSKNLRVAVLLCVAKVKLEGIDGLRDGLTFLQGLLERYWADVYPKLDPADNNDPLERINIVSSLATPMGTFGDPLRFLARVRQIPITHYAQLGRRSNAAQGGETVAGEAPPTVAEFTAALRDTPPANLQAIFQGVTDSIAAVRGIDDFLTRTVGADKAPDMGALLGALAEMQKAIVPHVPGANLTADGAGFAAPEAAATGQGNISGAIQSREDVVRALDRICEYYSRRESTSPVPLLLQRARRMVEMDFMQIVSELAPDALGQVKMVAGTRDAESTGNAETS